MIVQNIPTPPGWRLRRVGDACQIVNGHPFDSETFASTGEVPLVRIRDLSSEEFETFVPEGTVPARVLLDDGDLVVGMDGDFESIHWRRGRAALNQRLCLLRARPEVDLRFIGYALPTHLKVINDLTYATTVKHLSSGQVSAVRLPMPALEEQRRIAEFLDRETAQIDELIAKQEQLIGALSERFLAQVKRVAGVSSSGSAASTAPSLRRVARLATGGTPSGDEVSEEETGVPWFRPDDLDETGQVSTATRFITQDHADSLPRVEPGSTLVCAIGATLGKLGFVDSECSTNQQITAVTFSDSVLPRFGYYALLAERQQIMSLSVGNTLPIINNLRLGATKVSVPSRERQREIVRQLDEHWSLVRGLTSRAEQAVGLLRERRQALISAAVTGQIDVGGAS